MPSPYIPGTTRTTLAVRPENRIKLRRLGGAKWLRATLDVWNDAQAPVRQDKRVQTCVKLTPDQRLTLLRHGGADFLDKLIEGASDVRT